MRPGRLTFTLLFFAGAVTMAPAQSRCAARFVAGEPAGAPAGPGSAMQVFDPDGSGPAPAELAIGGRLDDGAATGPVFAYDGTRWRPVGAPPAGECTALGLFNGELIAAIRTSSSSDVAAWNGTSWRVLGTILGHANCMAVFNARLVLGGSFNSVNGIPAANVVQWDGTAWSALGSGVTGTGLGNQASALAVFNGVLWVGGQFTQAGGIPVGNLATWSGSTWAASANLDGSVSAMAVRLASTAGNSFLFVGGSFTHVGALAAQGVARFNPLTTWTSIGAFPPGTCSSLLVRSTGSFTFDLIAGSIPHLWNGSSWTELGVGRPVANALAVFGGRYVALGFDATVRALDATGTWVGLSGPGIDGPVKAAAAAASDVVIGGSFSSISGVTMNGIARGTVGAWQPLGSGVAGGPVNAVAIMPNGDVIAGGTFTHAGGAPANRIARWNGSTWSPLGPGLGGPATTDEVLALAVRPDGSLVAAGAFQQAGSLALNNVARWDGTAWTGMGAGLSAPGFTPHVRCLAVRPDGEVVAGGEFTESGGLPMGFAARWNGGSWSRMPGDPNGGVRALATLASGDVLAGGLFTAVGNLSTAFLARWNGSAWAAVPGLSFIPFGLVDMIAPAPDGGALIGTNLSGSVGPRLARYDGQSVTALPDPGFLRPAMATRASTGEMVFVGDFLRPGNVVSAYVARFVSPCPALVRTYGLGCAGSGGNNDLSALRLPVLGGTFTARATGMPQLGLVLAMTGLAQTSIPLASLLPQGRPGCNLLTTPDLIDFLRVDNGNAQTTMPIPPSMELIGLVLHHQILALELDGGANIVAATSTNGLQLTVGVF